MSGACRRDRRPDPVSMGGWRRFHPSQERARRQWLRRAKGTRSDSWTVRLRLYIRMTPRCP